MEDGKGVLKDGTRYIRESGEDFGANGYWKRWTRLAGVSAQGKVIISVMCTAWNRDNATGHSFTMPIQSPLILWHLRELEIWQQGVREAVF